MKKIAWFFILVLFIPVFAFAQTAVSLDAALKNATTYLNGRIPPRTKVVVLNFTSDWVKLSDYVIEELIGYIVNEGTLTVVDRQNLETIRKEMDFQLSGEVSDDTAQSIGKKLGAQTIISGAITAIGNSYRLRIRAISVETAQILGMQNVDVAQDSRIASLTGTAYSTATNTTKTSSNTNTTNTVSIFSYLPNQSDMSIITDSVQGGKTTGTFIISKEVIDGIERNVINLSITRNKGYEYPWGQLHIEGPIIERAKTASGIRFKIYGDGKPWVLEAATSDRNDNVFFRYNFKTIKNKVSTIDIPYTKFILPEWAKTKSIFNKNFLHAFQFVSDSNNESKSGTSQIKIFDIELY